MADPAKDRDETIDALQALVAGRYGERLTAAELEAVLTSVHAIEEMARALRGVKLDGTEEPMQPFVPFRAAP